MAHLWVFIYVTWAISSVSLHFPNPGLGSTTFSFSGMFTPGLTLLEYQFRQNSPASLADAKGARAMGAVTGAAVPAHNRTRRVSPGTHAPGTLPALERHPLTYCAPRAGCRCLMPRAKGAGRAGGDWPGIT